MYHARAFRIYRVQSQYLPLFVVRYFLFRVEPVSKSSQTEV